MVHEGFVRREGDVAGPGGPGERREGERREREKKREGERRER